MLLRTDGRTDEGRWYNQERQNGKPELFSEKRFLR